VISAKDGRKLQSMKLLFLLLALTSVARADWHDHVVQSPCGCWKSTISFFNADENAPYRVEELAEREDGAVMLVARFQGEAKMSSKAGKFQHASPSPGTSLLLLSFNLAGRLVASNAVPLDGGDFSSAGALHVKFVSESEVTVTGDGYDWLVSFDTAKIIDPRE